MLGAFDLSTRLMHLGQPDRTDLPLKTVEYVPLPIYVYKVNLF